MNKMIVIEIRPGTLHLMINAYEESISISGPIFEETTLEIERLKRILENLRTKKERKGEEDEL